MNNTGKPIKRSKELAPLSREHHEGLLLGWKIKQGLRNGTDHEVIAQYIQWFWENDLKEHFKKEEEILAVHLPENNELVQRMLTEHKEIEALIQLNAASTSEDVFLRIANALHDHIRFEERVLFPFAEKVIETKTMEAIFEDLVKIKEKTRWTDEFWVRK